MVLVGLGLTAVMVGVGWKLWGVGAVLSITVFGGLATAIQVVATTKLRAARDLPFAGYMAKHAVGMGLRLGGVVLIPVTALIDRTMFPPVPSACAYLGVLLPLLVLELRLAR